LITCLSASPLTKPFHPHTTPTGTSWLPLHSHQHRTSLHTSTLSFPHYKHHPRTAATMQSPHRSYATQATLAGMSNQGDNEATLSALSTADLGYAGTLGSQAYLASTDSRGRLIQVDPRQDAQIRTQNSQRHAQLQASGNETVSKWNSK
jgi:hypothetical protein